MTNCCIVIQTKMYDIRHHCWLRSNKKISNTRVQRAKINKMNKHHQLQTSGVYKPSSFCKSECLSAMPVCACLCACVKDRSHTWTLATCIYPTYLQSHVCIRLSWYFWWCQPVPQLSGVYIIRRYKAQWSMININNWHTVDSLVTRINRFKLVSCVVQCLSSL